MAMIIDCRRVQFFEYKQAEGAISHHKLKIYQSVYRPVNSSILSVCLPVCDRWRLTL